tara:strand:- start:228 stop:1130 length:903 start_codon:yes stop_codon:yes gene_type:complete
METMNKIVAAVNWHFWPRCNYGCKFCFATFEDIPLKDRLAKEDALKLPKILAEAGVEKITFVGGEPTLCPYLGDLLIMAKKANLTTCIVSNGTGLTSNFFDKYSKFIDWVGLSIDASNDDLHYMMGRGLYKDLNKGHSNHLKNSIETWELCKRYGIRMKLNTVVCKTNLDDNMIELVSKLRPERWKIFQVLPVKGQNDSEIEELMINSAEFNKWVERHRSIANTGVPFIVESNELMRGSYAMIDALGRFYTNVDGGHKYSPSIFEKGVHYAWKKNVFLEEKFLSRGGIYDWNKKLPILIT